MDVFILHVYTFVYMYVYICIYRWHLYGMKCYPVPNWTYDTSLARGQEHAFDLRGPWFHMFGNVMRYILGALGQIIASIFAVSGRLHHARVLCGLFTFVLNGVINGVLVAAGHFSGPMPQLGILPLYSGLVLSTFGLIVIFCERCVLVCTFVFACVCGCMCVVCVCMITCCVHLHLHTHYTDDPHTHTPTRTTKHKCTHRYAMRFLLFTWVTLALAQTLDIFSVFGGAAFLAYTPTVICVLRCVYSSPEFHFTPADNTHRVVHVRVYLYSARWFCRCPRCGRSFGRVALSSTTVHGVACSLTCANTK